VGSNLDNSVIYPGEFLFFEKKFILNTPPCTEPALPPSLKASEGQESAGHPPHNDKNRHLKNCASHLLANDDPERGSITRGNTANGVFPPLFAGDYVGFYLHGNKKTSN
jgi:hypothetical protein